MNRRQKALRSAVKIATHGARVRPLRFPWQRRIVIRPWPEPSFGVGHESIPVRSGT